jgi:hypothetical protein
MEGPTGTGPAALLWTLPAIATVTYALMSLVRFLPGRSMNYPVKVTDENREAVYATVYYTLKMRAA